jgi:ABC-type oligopeptide transport system substrate-binding subunit
MPKGIASSSAAALPVVRRVLALAVLALLLPFGPAPASAKGDEELIRYNDNGAPVLDPARYAAGRMSDERLLIAVLEPLTTLDPETGKVRPGAALSWVQGHDGRTWTFLLRPTAKWSDNSPVTAEDFVRSWKRTLERSTDASKASPWVSLLYALEGCRDLISNAARTELFSALRSALEDAIGRHQATGIPGREVNDILTDLGVRPYLTGIKGRSIQLLAAWEDDKSFPVESVQSVNEALKDARRDAKNAYRKALDAFGHQGSGAWAKDATTLVLTTDGTVPYLPELVARGVFAPMHKDFERIRDKLFDDAHNFISNGPFHFEGRGPRPPYATPNEPTASLVHLMRSPTYDGPNVARSPGVKCLTEQWANESAMKREDLRMFREGETDHVFGTWRELPPTDAKKPENDIRGQYEKAEGFRTRPTGTVVYLLFRCDRPPFSKKEARQAFAQLIDTSKVAKVFWPEAEPLTRLVPEGIEGRLDGVRMQGNDPVAAQKAFKAAKFDPEEWIEVSYGAQPGLDDAARGLAAAWKKAFELETGERIESTEIELQSSLRAGKFKLMLLQVQGATNDPSAYIARFHSESPEGGLGWRDAALDALLDAARDPQGSAARKDALLKLVPGDARLRAALDGAGTPAGQEALRRALLAAAEQRLLDEFVVLPICVLREAELAGRIKGWGSDVAWRNPGFVGALWAATK